MSPSRSTGQTLNWQSIVLQWRVPPDCVIGLYGQSGLWMADSCQATKSASLVYCSPQ
jgi:hypothetical protein